VNVSRLSALRPPQDGKNRSDADIDVDVGGTIERIENDRVFGPRRAVVQDDRFFVLLGGKNSNAVAAAQTIEERIVGIDIELLLLFALDIARTLRS